MSGSAAAARLFTIEGARGPLCAVYHEPAAGVAPIGDVLVVPPFGEEMNRCRAMVALQARALAAAGAGTLVLDPYGTGDSAGEFIDADWSTWRDDLLRGVDWLGRHGHGCRSLLAVRLGAIMAAELAARREGIRHLVLWLPALQGKTFYTQFLRIRVAAEMNLAERVKSTGELRQMSAAGQPVEVSGYEVGPRLAAELDALAFDAVPLRGRVEIDWFEVNSDDPPTFSPAALKNIESLQAAGDLVRPHSVGGPAFWQVHERELAPQLIDATRACIAARAPAAGTPGGAPPPAADPGLAEQPLTLRCADDQLSAVLHRGRADATRGAVIVVAGGPQYRVGAHRQFVTMARKLAGQGHPVLRFDLRGMGDSSGSYQGFEHSEADIRAAIDTLLAHSPSLREVVLIGECESASGILFYAWRDPRVQGAVLINPWVRTEEGRAQVIVNHYYLERLRSPEFWAKIRRGEFQLGRSLKSLVEVGRAYVRGRRMFARAQLVQGGDDLSALPLPVRTATGLSRFKGRVLLLMSGNDYIAREFDDVTAASRAWDGLLLDPRVQRVDVEGADHTFSKKAWKGAATDAILGWMRGA